METERLRWFVAVAKTGGIRNAATLLRVSPGALSKGIADLEGDLGQRLFVRSSRGFALTDAGGYLRDRATELLRVEEDIRERLERGASPRRVLLSGTEPLVALHFAEVLRLTQERFPDALLEVRATRDDDATRATLQDEPASLALVTQVSRAEPARALPSAPFGTFVGLGHPLAARAERGVPVADVQSHVFVVPDREVFGPMTEGASADGWRDDQFPRKKRVGASSQALVHAYVESGHAIAYLPIALGKRLEVRRLKVTGCPYSCTCEAYLVRSGAAPGWVRQIL